MVCPLCRSVLFLKMDDAYYVCDVCKGIALDSKLYLDNTSEKMRYQKHNNGAIDAGYRQFTSPIWQYILDNFQNKNVGLDYGCGNDSIISDILKKNGFQIVSYDPFFFANTEVLKAKFNFIVACEVIEHFQNPAEEFRRLRNMLLPGGELLCMTHIYNPTIDFSQWY